MLAGQAQANRPQDVVAYARIEPFLDIYSLDRAEAETAGTIIGKLRAQGLRLEHSDPYIAATAMENDLDLVTANTRHYQRFVDLGYPLRLVNWRNEVPER